MDDGQAFVAAGNGIEMMQLLFVVNWDTPVKVCYSQYELSCCGILVDPTPGVVASCCNRNYRVGPERQPVLQDHFYCRGSERNLSQCSRIHGFDCGHERDVAVICS